MKPRKSTVDVSMTPSNISKNETPACWKHKSHLLLDISNFNMYENPAGSGHLMYAPLCWYFISAMQDKTKCGNAGLSHLSATQDLERDAERDSVFKCSQTDWQSTDQRTWLMSPRFTDQPRMRSNVFELSFPETGPSSSPVSVQNCDNHSFLNIHLKFKHLSETCSYFHSWILSYPTVAEILRSLIRDWYNKQWAHHFNRIVWFYTQENWICSPFITV